MSNIYIQEPLTSGKVILKTTVGEIEIELWSKEAPLACRNFIQLCMENYYNNTIFHRVVKNFIVQGGDPTGTGEGGESVYGHPFKDEFHTRLRFCRRGLVAMANAGKDDNGSQFFFTLAATQELQNKHTIFGKVAGDTLYNMLKLGEGLVDEDERPQYPQKIISTKVISNPFNDIVPRYNPELKESDKKPKKKDKTAAVKNFKLLSFGEEAEEDEEETIAANKQLVKKGKSAHDTLADPKLSSEPAVETNTDESKTDEEEIEEVLQDNEDDEERKATADRIKNKLLNKILKDVQKKENAENEADDEEDIGKSQAKEKDEELKKIRKDIRDLIKGVQTVKKLTKTMEIKEKKEQALMTEAEKEYFEMQAKYKEAQKKLPKGDARDDFAAKLLASFRNRLHSVKSTVTEESKETEETEDDDSWMKHELKSEEDLPVLAKDASTKDDDWFEIYDPRNPINKRRRGEITNKSKKLKK